jgi:hypothetical protein
MQYYKINAESLLFALKIDIFCFLNRKIKFFLLKKANEYLKFGQRRFRQAAVTAGLKFISRAPLFPPLFSPKIRELEIEFFERFRKISCHYLTKEY